MTNVSTEKITVGRNVNSKLSVNKGRNNRQKSYNNINNHLEANIYTKDIYSQYLTIEEMEARQAREKL